MYASMYVHGENFMEIFTTLSVVIHRSISPGTFFLQNVCFAKFAKKKKVPGLIERLFFCKTFVLQNLHKKNKSRDLLNDFFLQNICFAKFAKKKKSRDLLNDVLIWFSTGTLGIFATLVCVFTMRVVLYAILSMAIFPHYRLPYCFVICANTSFNKSRDFFFAKHLFCIKLINALCGDFYHTVW